MFEIQVTGLLAIKSSTTEGSARVEVSPMLSISFSAILRKMRRMILPERVFNQQFLQKSSITN